MKLPEIPNKGKKEPQETIFRGESGPQLIDGDTHSIFKDLNLEFLLAKENIGTMCGPENEGTAMQILSHIGICPIYRYQTQTLLLMPKKCI